MELERGATENIEEADLFELGGRELPARAAPDASAVVRELADDARGVADSGRWPAARSDASGLRLRRPLPPPASADSIPPALMADVRDALPASHAGGPAPAPGGTVRTYRPPAPRRWTLLAALAAGVVVTAALAMNLLAASGSLLLTVQPPDAEVSVDGVQVPGTGVFSVDGLDPSRAHLVVVRRQGYQGWHARVRVRSGERLRLPAIVLSMDANGAR